MQSLYDESRRRRPGAPATRQNRRPVPRWIQPLRLVAPVRPARWKVILPPHPVLH